MLGEESDESSEDMLEENKTTVSVSTASLLLLFQS
jgi:hypothetical protein